MSLEIAIKKTFNYAGKYGSILTLKELEERLISDKIYSEKEIEKKVLSIKYQALSIKNNSPEKEIKIKKAEELVNKYLVKFEDILMVGITGSVAAGHPQKKDDIDLMIITKKNKLWWTRLKLRYLIFKNKIPHRKYEEKENKDEFCFNLWLDENNLLIPKFRQNLRSAMDLILMKPILNRNNIYTKFIQENSWVKKYVATGYAKKILEIQNLFALRAPLPTSGDLWTLDRGAFIFFIVNFLVFVPQYLFMRRKMTHGEEVGLKKAFFNKIS